MAVNLIDSDDIEVIQENEDIMLNIKEEIKNMINNIATGESGYLKLAEGTLICYGKTQSANINQNNEYQESITLPQNYLSSNFITIVSLASGGAGWANVICRGDSTSSNTINVTAGNYITGSSTAQNIIVSYITIGRWK